MGSRRLADGTARIARFLRRLSTAEARAEDVMEAGPSTVRAARLRATVRTAARADRGYRSDGRLLGLVRSVDLS